MCLLDSLNMPVRVQLFIASFPADEDDEICYLVGIREEDEDRTRPEQISSSTGPPITAPHNAMSLPRGSPSSRGSAASSACNEIGAWVDLG